MEDVDICFQELEDCRMCVPDRVLIRTFWIETIELLIHLKLANQGPCVVFHESIHKVTSTI